MKKQFEVVKKLYNRSDISAIYYAGDPAREGIYIQMLVRQEAGHTPGIEEKVVWIDSQTEDEIRRGIKEAKPLSEYQNLSDSGYARAIEDFAVGINLSRAITLKYRNTLNAKTPLAVGRVMTCVLGIIVEREKEIENFVPTKFYKVRSKIEVDGEDIFAEWKPERESDELYNGIGFNDRTAALAFAERLPSRLSITSVENSEERKYAPPLFNQTELQAYCSKALKISPDETLKIAQSLYEKKMTTYPRTSARVLSSAVAKEISYNMKKLLAYSPEIADAINEAGHSGRIANIANTKYTDDSKVVDHYAV